MPSSIVCYFCGNTGHKQVKCPKKEKSTQKNEKFVEQIWVMKNNPTPITQEPKETWVPDTNV